MIDDSEGRWDECSSAIPCQRVVAVTGECEWIGHARFGVERHVPELRSSVAKYQEIEGPPIAPEILDRLGFAPATVDHVCRIVGSHHSARDIDTPEFRIVWDADWLVNLSGDESWKTREQFQRVVERTFVTPTGRRLANSLRESVD